MDQATQRQNFGHQSQIVVTSDQPFSEKTTALNLIYASSPFAIILNRNLNNTAQHMLVLSSTQAKNVDGTPSNDVYDLTLAANPDWDLWDVQGEVTFTKGRSGFAQVSHERTPPDPPFENLYLGFFCDLGAKPAHILLKRRPCVRSEFLNIPLRPSS